MPGDRTLRGLARRYRRVALSAAVLAMIGAAALAGDRPSGAVKDEIFARKILMNAIDGQIDAIDWMVTSNKPFDLSEAIDRAGTVSAMLLALPHLFPPETNQWREGAVRDPARDTFASPDLWLHFDDFYRRAGEASRLALVLSQAKSRQEVEQRFEAVRETCASCHGLYVKSGD